MSSPKQTQKPAGSNNAHKIVWRAFQEGSLSHQMVVIYQASFEIFKVLPGLYHKDVNWHVITILYYIFYLHSSTGINLPGLYWPLTINHITLERLLK